MIALSRSPISLRFIFADGTGSFTWRFAIASPESAGKGSSPVAKW
jgi:hypothetical protein